MIIETFLVVCPPLSLVARWDRHMLMMMLMLYVLEGRCHERDTMGLGSNKQHQHTEERQVI